MKKISVIIPVYNVKCYLNRCLDSILNQTYKNLQIILVDDGSDDGSEKICDEYEKKDNRIMVIHKKNEGQSIARKIGLEHSDGDLISFIDSDDFVSLNFYNDMQKPFDDKNIDMVYCNIYPFNQNNEYKISESDTDVSTTYIKKTKEECFKDLVSNNSCINNYMWNKVYRKELFTNIIFPQNNIFEDLAIMYKIIANAKDICFIDKSLYYYFNREGSSSKKIRSSIIIYKLSLINEREEFIEKNYSNIIRDYQMYHIKNIILGCTVIAKNREKKDYDSFISNEKDYLKEKIKELGLIRIIKHFDLKNRLLFLMFSINKDLFYKFISFFWSYRR